MQHRCTHLSLRTSFSPVQALSKANLVFRLPLLVEGTKSPETVHSLGHYDDNDQQHLVLSLLQCVSIFSLSPCMCTFSSHLVFAQHLHSWNCCLQRRLSTSLACYLSVSLISPFQSWVTLPSCNCYLTYSVEQVVSIVTPIFPLCSSFWSHTHFWLDSPKYLLVQYTERNHERGTESEHGMEPCMWNRIGTWHGMEAQNGMGTQKGGGMGGGMGKHTNVLQCSVKSNNRMEIREWEIIYQINWQPLRDISVCLAKYLNVLQCPN
jgi:hypothetical protein